MPAPQSLADLRKQLASNKASTDTADGRRTTEVLERVKTNRSQQQDAQACIFQKLSLDTGVVDHLQKMLPGIGTMQNAILGDGEAEVVPTRWHSSRRAGAPSLDGPTILIPVNTERIRIQDMKAALKDEYAARYCESLGVMPTQQNMNLVQRLMPFESCKLSHSTQQGGARGERRGNIVIQPAFLSAKPVTTTVEDLPYEYLSLDVPKGNDTTTAPGGSAHSPTASVGADKPENNAAALVSFEQYKSKFVFPFNLKERFESNGGVGGSVDKSDTHNKSSGEPGEGTLSATQKLAMQDQLLSKIRNGAAVEGAREGALPPLPGSARGPPRPPSRDDQSALSSTTRSVGRPTSTEPREVVGSLIRRELDQPWNPVEVSEVRSLQAQFIRDFPFFRFNGRLNHRELIDLKSRLVQEDAAVLIVSLIRFLFSAYVAPLSEMHRLTMEASSSDSLFVELYRNVVAFTSGWSRNTSGSNSTVAHEEMPLQILLFRVVVAAIVSYRLPTFVAYEDGKQMLQSMDNLVVALLDPFGLLAHIVVLESTPQAQRIARTKRIPTRMSSSATSPLIQFIVGDNLHSTEAKKLSQPQPQSSEPLAELKKHVTPTVRAELLRIFSSQKLAH